MLQRSDVGSALLMVDAPARSLLALCRALQVLRLAQAKIEEKNILDKWNTKGF